MRTEHRAAILIPAIALAGAIAASGGGWAEETASAIRGPDPVTETRVSESVPEAPAPVGQAPESPTPSARPVPPEVGEAAYVDLPAECVHVRRLRIVRHNIFAPGEPYARSFYGRLANRLHITTREHVIRRGLRFETGDRVCRRDLAAAVRRLRDYRFLHGNIELEVERAVADSVDLVVRTRDVWTTRPTFEFRKEGKVFTWSLGLSESNLFGLGKGLGLEIGHDDVKAYHGGWFRDPQFGGQDMLFVTGLFDGDDLWSRSLLLERPFAQATTPWGVRIEAQRYRGVYVDRRGGVDGPEWHTDQWLVTASAGVRIWGTDRDALRCGPAAYLVSERYRLPDEDPQGALALGDELARREIRGVGVELDFSRERYSQRAGINSFFRREDFDLGTRIQMRVAYSPADWGAARDGGVMLGEGYQGWSLGPRRFMLGAILAEARWVDGHSQDVRIESGVYYYDNLSYRHTLGAALRHNRGEGIPPQAVYTLGAITGLRGFESYRFWGERTLLLNLEDRIVLVQDLLGLVTAGLTLFADGGIAWRAGRHEEARPRAAVGIGLRLLGSRASGALVTRVDLGFAVLGAEGEHKPVLSVGAGQIF